MSADESGCVGKDQKKSRKTHPTWDSNPQPLDVKPKLYNRSLTRYHCASGTIIIKFALITIYIFIPRSGSKGP